MKSVGRERREHGKKTYESPKAAELTEFSMASEALLVFASNG